MFTEECDCPYCKADREKEKKKLKSKLITYTQAEYDAGIEQAKQDAERYRALRHSLSNEDGCSTLEMPEISVPFSSHEQTYTPEGLDKAVDDAIAILNAGKEQIDVSIQDD